MPKPLARNIGEIRRHLTDSRMDRMSGMHGYRAVTGVGTNGARVTIRAFLGLLACLMLAGGCVMDVAVESCATEDENAPVLQVGGTYRYSGTGVNANSGQTFRLSGTVTLEQSGNMVRVSDSTYDNINLRPVESTFAELDGNRLFLLMTPINGDEDYMAAVKFVFNEEGTEFCVEYQDTNSDMGELGSFRGERMEESE